MGTLTARKIVYFNLLTVNCGKFICYKHVIYCTFVVIISEQQTEQPYFLSLKRTTMKKFLALAFAGFMLTVILAACGSARGGHCDAYGNVDQIEIENDLAAL